MRGEFTSMRIDVNYWRLSAFVKSRLKGALYQPHEVGTLVSLVQYGCSKLASSEPVGTPILRMNNLQANGWDLRDLKWVQLSDSELETYRLQREDLLFNRTNSKELVGKCEVFRETGEWVFASYLIRVRTDESRLRAQFASDFFNSAAGRLQIDQMSRQIIGMTNINAEEIKSIRIPVPPPRRQDEFIAAMNVARAERQARLAEAESLLASLDGVVLRAAGYRPPPPPRKVFAVRSGELTGALNPDRYRAMQLEKSLPFDARVGECGTLLDARCSPQREAPTQVWDWIRIDDLPNQPWQVENVRTERGANIGGTFFEVQENDILLARLGPTILNAKFVLCPKLTRRTVASAEFLVLRCHAGWRPVAVLWLLRTKLYRDIMYLRSRGGTPSRFRLSAEDLAAIPFPRLDDLTQTEIASEVQRCHERSRRLRADAEEGWQASKRLFEEKLLGPVQP